MAVVVRTREEQIKAIHDAFFALMWIAKRQFTQRLQAFGLTPPQFVTLATLVAHKQACTMSDLINVTFQDAPTMTGIIDRLVKVKLAHRSRSETDRRVVLVEATPAGIELFKQIEEKIFQDDSCTYEDLTDQDLVMIEQLLIYLLRAQVGRSTSSDVDLDTGIQKLLLFQSDPIYYTKLETENITPAQ